MKGVTTTNCNCLSHGNGTLPATALVELNGTSIPICSLYVAVNLQFWFIRSYECFGSARSHYTVRCQRFRAITALLTV
jgi:hypothetical protein